MNKVQALNKLREGGFKIGKTKFYEDIKKGRLIVRNGKVNQESLKLYMAELDKPSGDPFLAAATRQAGLARNIELKNRRLKFECEREEGRYVSKKEADQTLVQTLVAFFSLLRNRFHVDAPDIIEKFDGDAARV